MLSGICQHDEVQPDLFAHSKNNEADRNDEKSQRLMALMDTINQKTKGDTHKQSLLFMASEGITKQQSWQMNRQQLSPCYTTRVEDLVVAK